MRNARASRSLRTMASVQLTTQNFNRKKNNTYLYIYIYKKQTENTIRKSTPDGVQPITTVFCFLPRNAFGNWDGRCHVGKILQSFYCESGTSTWQVQDRGKMELKTKKQSEEEKEATCSPKITKKPKKQFGNRTGKCG